MNVYDYHARIYDPAAPHFWQIDPKAETSRRFSPYAYALDNPVYFIDPDGMQAVANDTDPPKTKKTAWQRAYNPKTGNTDLLKVLVYKASDFIESINTYKDVSDKDIGDTATHKEGKGNTQKTTGTTGDQTETSAFLTAAPGSEKSGNHIKNFKELLEGGKDIMDLFDKGQKVGEGVNEIVEENRNKRAKQTEFIYLVKDDKDPNNNVQVRREDHEAQQKKKKE